MYGISLFVLFVLWVVSLLAGVLMAERRGQPKWLGFVCALLLGPAGVWLVSCSIDDPRAIEESLLSRRQAKQCRRCWSIAHPRAEICPACHAPIP